jgi:glycosyltransferase involved in cell wall biosynthesis
VRHASIAGARRRIRDSGGQRPIVVASLPNAADVVGAFNESLVVYVCEDEHSEMPGVDPVHVGELEAALLARADVVLVTSRALCEPKSTARAPATLLSQGVDFDHFHCRVAHPTPPPRELASAPRPRLGFIGAVAPWVDVDLLTAVARRYPEAALVVVGSISTDVSALRRLPNVVFIGPRPYADAPRYVAQFDVGLIPFRRTRLTQYVNPLKLLEYFAAGLPVVSTPLPDLSVYGDLVYTADSAEGFLSQITDALADTSASRRERRFATARANTWTLRAERVSELLGHALDSGRRDGSAA